MATEETLPLIIDGIIILIFIMSIIGGYRKGFVRMVLSIAAVIICVVVAKEACVPAAEWVNEEFVHENVVEYIADTVSESVESSADNIVSQLPGQIVDAAEELGISLSELAENAANEEALKTTADEIVTQAEGFLILPVLQVICFAVLYFALQAVCSVLIRFINAAFKLPIISGLNKTLGAICGGAKGVIAIAAVCLIIVSMQPLFADMPLGQAVEEAELMNTIYEVTFGLIN